MTESFNFITKKNRMLVLGKHGKSEFGIAEVLGDWSEHYKSWKNIKFAPSKIVRYEDLISNTEITFISILNFLKNFMDIDINKNKVKKAIDSCSFDILSNKEKKEGFDESITDKSSGKKIKFFNLGKKNDWKKLLDSKIEEQIRFKFNKEMKELGYN